MKMYKAHQPITLSSGKLTLTKEQASSREYCVEKVKKGKNIYLITGKVQFKKGEEFGHDGVIPKAQIEAINTNDDNVENDADVLLIMDRPFLDKNHSELVSEILLEGKKSGVDLDFLKEHFPALIDEIIEGAELTEINLIYLEEKHPELVSEIKLLGGSGEVSNIDNIIEAIKLLNEENADHWTNEGLPQVTAIEAVLESDITAEERDEAVEKISDMSALHSRLFEKKE